MLVSCVGKFVLSYALLEGVFLKIWEFPLQCSWDILWLCVLTVGDLVHAAVWLKGLESQGSRLKVPMWQHQ